MYCQVRDDLVLFVGQRGIHIEVVDFGHVDIIIRTDIYRIQSQRWDTLNRPVFEPEHFVLT